MKLKVTPLLIIRIVIVFVGLYFMYSSSLEGAIVRDTRAFPYPITNVYCSNGGKKSSYLEITAKGKLYEVSVSGRQDCSSFKEGEKVQLYYNDLLDYYFFEDQNQSSMIIICMLLFGGTFLWQIIDQYRKEKRQ